MSFDLAQRLCELLCGLALVQQSLEHCFGPARAHWLYWPRLLLAVLLVVGVQPGPALAALLGLGVVALARFDGPYNGGSDRLTLLLLSCLFVARITPSQFAAELALGYLAVQVLLSYGIAGAVKLANPDWRSGRALVDVFAFSAYPASESLRGLQYAPRLLLVASWGVIALELLLPVTLVSRAALLCALALAALFHIGNAVLFGFNRFLWIWLASYPALVWLQGRLLPG